MPLQLFKLQLKRIAIPYGILTLAVVGWALFSPQIIKPSFFFLFPVALYVGLCGSLAWWATPEDYLRIMPISTTGIRMAYHLTPTLLVAAPLTVVTLIYATGLKGVVMERLYGITLFKYIAGSQTQTILTLSALALLATQFVTLACSQTKNVAAEFSATRRQIAFMPLSFSACCVFAFLLFQGMPWGMFILTATLMGALAAAGVYLNPFDWEHTIDSYLVGGSMRQADRRKRLPFACVMAAILLIGEFLIIQPIVVHIQLGGDAVLATFMSALLLSSPFFAIVFPFMWYRRCRHVGMGMAASAAATALCALVWPAYPFLYCYSLFPATGFNIARRRGMASGDEDWDIHDPDSLERKTRGKKMLFTFMLYLVIIILFDQVFDSSRRTTIVTDPPGQAIMVRGKPLDKPNEIEYAEAAFAQVAGCRIYAMAVRQKTLGGTIITLKLLSANAISDAELAIDNLKRSGASSAALAKLSQAETLKLLRYLITLPPERIKDVENLCASLVTSYVSRLDGQEAKAMARELLADYNNSRWSPANNLNVELAQAIILKFPAVKEFWVENMVGGALDSSLFHIGDQYAQDVMMGVPDKKYLQWALTQIYSGHSWRPTVYGCWKYLDALLAPNDPMRTALAPLRDKNFAPMR